MLDLNKYDNKKFNNDSFINKRIKALFLLFDKHVIDFKLNYFQKQKLINVWIYKLVKHEEYELAEAFKQRKIRMWRKWRKVHRLGSYRLFWRVWRKRINKLIRNIFNGKKVKYQQNKKR